MYVSMVGGEQDYLYFDKKTTIYNHTSHLFLIYHTILRFILVEYWHFTHMWKELALPHNFSLKERTWAHRINLTSPLFIEVHVSSQESEHVIYLCVRGRKVSMSCICVLGVGK